MQLPQILFLVLGAIALGAALVVVTRRNLLHASLALIVSCIGVAGLLALLDAPLIAALQLLVFAGGIALLIRTNPLPAQVTRPGTLGTNNQWWMAALLSAALCVVLSWVAFSYGHDLRPAGNAAALGPASLDLISLILPLTAAVASLSIAVVGAVTIVRKR